MLAELRHLMKTTTVCRGRSAPRAGSVAEVAVTVDELAITAGSRTP